jgi:hypothetical protein
MVVSGASAVPGLQHRRTTRPAVKILECHGHGFDAAIGRRTLRIIHCDHDVADLAAVIRARMSLGDADERIAAAGLISIGAGVQDLDPSGAGRQVELRFLLPDSANILWF